MLARMPLAAALSAGAGTYGPVVVGAAGDVAAGGEAPRDCPPFVD